MSTQHMFLWRNKKTIYLLLILSTAVLIEHYVDIPMSQFVLIVHVYAY